MSFLWNWHTIENNGLDSKTGKTFITIENVIRTMAKRIKSRRVKRSPFIDNLKKNRANRKAEELRLAKQRLKDSRERQKMERDMKAKTPDAVKRRAYLLALIATFGG